MGHWRRGIAALAPARRNLAVPPSDSLRFCGLIEGLFWLFAHVYFLIGLPQSTDRDD
jgi:hypothetical protein